ncbi:protein kinase domain protein [Vairimorpha apis BRL 01]|uniref:Serine/threonine-protein kinase n=1 Tax=Vairimorpha apis BRL 01 TaxID=1037528 RepID=T0MG18_9MICR|nr:protein kinase domain protein [Vairimorpha apis BRL 01]
MASKVDLYFKIGTIVIDPETGTKYTLKKYLGRGAYAQCYLVHLDDGDSYAMKIVKLKELKSKKVHEKLKSELEIHSSLDHEFVVKMYKYFKNDEYVFMLLELCEQGALDSLLKRNGKLKERYVVKFVKQIVLGLIYLHECNVVHRDLKLGNLFLDSKLNIKIGDFGLSARIVNGERKVTMCGTPNYIAPEVLYGKDGGHSYEVDIWSVGVIIYTLLIGVPPFQKDKVEEIYKEIKHTNYIFPQDCDLSSAAIDLINQILTLDPLERPTLQEILNHKFLNKKEHFLLRIYKNLVTNKYKEQEITNDYIVFSIPLNKYKGIGYILKSGTYGFYFNDKRNIMLKPNKKSLLYIQANVINGKKTFLQEEHLVEKIPEDILPFYKILEDFIDKFEFDYEFQDMKQAFIIKIRKIKGGLLFVMSDSTLIFDFSNDNKVIISNGGERVLCYKGLKICNLDKMVRENCIEIIKKCLDGQ